MLTKREILASRVIDGIEVYVTRCEFKDNDGYRRVDYVVEDDCDNYDVFKTKQKALSYLKNLG